jgi:hypothetical protein
MVILQHLPTCPKVDEDFSGLADTEAGIII